MENISTYITKNISVFTNQTVDVEVEAVCGTGEPVILSVNAFIPLPNSTVQQTYHSQDGQPLGVESLPVGFVDLDAKSLGEETTKRIKNASQDPGLIVRASDHHTSSLAISVLEIVFRFHSSMPVVSVNQH